jgi:magnesium transporter
MEERERSEDVASELERLVTAGDFAAARRVLDTLHPADRADLVEDLPDDDRAALLATFDGEALAGLLEYLEPDLRARIVDGLAGDVLARALDHAEPELAADVLQDLPEEVRPELLGRLRERAAVQRLLLHEEESAGGRMSPDVVSLHLDWTVDQAITYLRRQKPDERHPFYLYAIDDGHRLRGVVNMRGLLTAAPQTPIASIMTPEVISVPVDYDQELAAERMRHYNLLALPVVEPDGRLAGVLTADEVLDVQVEEATEDMFRMVGLTERERLFRPIRESVPPRLAWLFVNLITALLAAVTVNAFEGTIEKIAALAVFMPVIAGMGGNAGIQTITLVVRSLALGEVEPRDAARVIRHELIIALIKGLALALVVGSLAWIWKDNTWLGIVVGLAMLINIANAALVGVLVPLALKVARADPALASGVIVTTFTDVIGFLTFLGLATLLVTKLT